MDLSPWKEYDVELPFPDGSRRTKVRFTYERYLEGGQGIYVGFDFVDPDTGQWSGPSDITTNVERVPLVDMGLAHVSLSDRHHLEPMLAILEGEGVLTWPNGRDTAAATRGFESFAVCRFDERIFEIARPYGGEETLRGFAQDASDDWRFSMSFPEAAVAFQDLEGSFEEVDREIAEAPEEGSPDEAGLDDVR